MLLLVHRRRSLLSPSIISGEKPCRIARPPASSGLSNCFFDALPFSQSLATSVKALWTIIATRPYAKVIFLSVSCARARPSGAIWRREIICWRWNSEETRTHQIAADERADSGIERRRPISLVRAFGLFLSLSLIVSPVPPNATGRGGNKRGTPRVHLNDGRFSGVTGPATATLLSWATQGHFYAAH